MWRDLDKGHLEGLLKSGRQNTTALSRNAQTHILPAWEYCNMNYDVEHPRSGRRRLVAASYLFLKRGERHLPPVVRGLLGILLIIAGALGFLPVLGFWMIPLGVALLATDVPALRLWFIKRLNHYRRRTARKTLR